MPIQRILRIVAVSLSASMYFASPPQGSLRPERGPMRPRAVVRPPRLDSMPSPSAR
jgi:hypothetical protein